MTRRVGRDVASAAYWAGKSASYIDTMDGPYHRHRMAMILALGEGIELRGRKCLDAGCGEGIFAEYLLGQGAEVDGFDISDDMIRAARRRLDRSDAAERFSFGGIERMAGFADAAFDCVFALNVLAYLNSEDEAAFYTEAARVLVPGGTLIITHSNELFDLFTLNRYTADFFRRHFSGERSECDVRDLLAHPDKPDRTTFAVRENPLSYRHKLARFGFEERQQEFAHFHPVPPLLTPDRDPDDINAHDYVDTLGWPEHERWKLAFMCSMFGSRAVKTEAP